MPILLTCLQVYKHAIFPMKPITWMAHFVLPNRWIYNRLNFARSRILPLWFDIPCIRPSYKFRSRYTLGKHAHYTRWPMFFLFTCLIIRYSCFDKRCHLKSISTYIIKLRDLQLDYSWCNANLNTEISYQSISSSETYITGLFHITTAHYRSSLKHYVFIVSSKSISCRSFQYILEMYVLKYIS